MRRWRWFAAAATAGSLLTALLIHYAPGPAGSQHQFLGLLESSRRPLAVHATVFDDLVIFHTATLGDFTIPTRCGPLGVGYVTGWVLPDGRSIVAAQPPADPTGSGAGYLNDSQNGVGLGAFSTYLAFSTPPYRQWDTLWSNGTVPEHTSWVVGSRRCRYPGVGWVSKPEITRTTYEQGLAVLRDRVDVRVKWTFTSSSAREDVWLTFTRPFHDVYVKEPEVAWSTNGSGAQLVSIGFPGTRCRTYTRLIDPSKRTGRCEQPAPVVLLNGFPNTALVVQAGDWRKLAATARSWPRAGDTACPGVTLLRVHPNIEVTAWNRNGGPYDSLAVLEKGWEGCVDSQDFTAGYRQPPRTRAYHLAVTLEPAE